MNKKTNERRSALLPTLGLFLSAVLLVVAPGVSAEEPTAEEAAAEQDLTFDNLVPVKDPKMELAFIDPDADFSVFKRVAILEPTVSFRSNWQRDQNRSRSRNIRARDMDRIRADVATLFERVFTERLEAAGYQIVDVLGDDVLVVRPAIIDLDVTAPDTRTAGRSHTISASTGAATLYIQLFDAVSGDIIGRAADRQVARNAGGRMTWANSVTNSAEARRMVGRWADRLVEFLQNHYK
jgi:hypothetical protein